MQKYEIPKSVYYSILLIIFMIVLLANISHSFRVGRLSAPPLYDDVSYFASAIKILAFSEGKGLASIVVAFLSNPVHAPLSTATGIFGFWLIGPNPVSAYIANAWILAVYLVSISTASKPLNNLLSRVLFVSIFMFVPASHAIVNEFRPDMAAGLLFGLAGYAICNVNFEVLSRQRSIEIGLLAAVAMIAKPSALIITGPMLGFAFICALLIQFQILGGDFRAIIARTLPGLFSFGLIIIPFLLLWGASTFSYIYQALITNADIWRTPGDWIFHWTYHSFGMGGKQALGPFLIAGLIIFTVDFIAVLKERSNIESRRIILFYLFLVVIYLGMSTTNEKTVFQGSFFYFPFVIGIAHSLIRLIIKHRENWADKDKVTVTFLAIIVAVVVVFSPLTSTYTIASATQKISFHAYNEAVFQISERINKMMNTPGCIHDNYKIVDTSPDPFPSIGIVFALATQGIKLENNSSYLSKSFDELVVKLADTDFVLSPDHNMPGVGRHLPGLKFLAQVNDELMINPLFDHHKIDTISGYPLWLFVRICKPD
jgi:hypothetical protein